MNRRGRVFAGLGLAVAGTALWIGSSTAVGQQSPSSQGGTTTLQVFSRLSVVDVTVTDSSGRPVQGLKQSDFTLFEDGKPQPIHNFEEVTEVGVPALPPLPDHVYTNLQPEAASSALNILLMDFANQAPKDSTNSNQLRVSIEKQHNVKDSTIRALDHMPTGTRIILLSMTNHLRVLQSLTSDRELLKAAIAAAPYDLDGNGDVQCVESDMRNRMVLESLGQIAADVMPIHGRKNLIWFTVGIAAITDPNDRPQCLPDYTAGLTHAYGLLNASQVSVYPVDANGLTNTARQGGAILSMDAVAEATGGVAYYNSNNIRQAVDLALDNGANYYSLAYIPPSTQYDGKYHKIEVKVDKPGVHAVYRKGYYADDLSKVTAKAGLTLALTPPPADKGNMKAPMSRGLPTSEDLLFDVQVEPSTLPAKPGDPPIFGTLDPKLKGKHLVRYGFQYDVPAKQIAFKNGPKGTHEMSLDFDIAVYDANEKLLTGLSQTLKSSLTEATYQQTLKGPARLFQQIDLPAGEPLFIRVGVLDHNSDKVGTLELPLNLGKNGQVKAIPDGKSGE
jgi:VWFA-related protein